MVAPQITDELEQLIGEHGGIWQQSKYSETDLHGKKLAVAATPDRPTNQQVYRDATALNLPVNVVDAAELCTFIFPSIVDRSPLTIAISSSGKSPVLARFPAQENRSPGAPPPMAALISPGKCARLLNAVSLPRRPGACSGNRLSRAPSANR